MTAFTALPEEAVVFRALRDSGYLDKGDIVELTCSEGGALFVADGCVFVRRVDQLADLTDYIDAEYLQPLTPTAREFLDGLNAKASCTRCGGVGYLPGTFTCSACDGLFLGAGHRP